MKDRFGLSRVIVVADRGMVTKANIELLAETDGVDWITALKAPTIKKLARSGVFQPSLFDEQNLGEITDVEEFPGERLIVCRNPLVGAQRARKREELLAATETDLAQIAHRVAPGTLLGADQIGLAVGPALKRYRMRKHFQIEITDTTFTYTRDTAGIAAEAALDGFYILRTSLTQADLAAGDVVRAYKNLEQAERAFGSLKGPDLQIRPIHHHLAERVRAHVLICMLAYYLTWHLKAAWKPLLFTDEHRPVSPDPVAKAVRSTSRAAESANETDHSRRSPRTATARSWPSSRPRRGTPPACTDTPARSRSSPSRPRCRPRRSISPRTPPSWSFGRHDPNTTNPPKSQGIRGIRLSHQGELRTRPGRSRRPERGDDDASVDRRPRHRCPSFFEQDWQTAVIRDPPSELTTRMTAVGVTLHPTCPSLQIRSCAKIRSRAFGPGSTGGMPTRRKVMTHLGQTNRRGRSARPSR